MKRLFAMLLILAVLLSLAACSNSSSSVATPGSSAHGTTDGTKETTRETAGSVTTTQTTSNKPTSTPAVSVTTVPEVPPTTSLPQITTVPPTTPPTTPPTQAPTAPPTVPPATACSHSWKAATCTEAKTCKTCGVTEGSAAGHSWKAATCTEAKTCKTCGVTEGSAAGHNWSAASCTEAKTCKTCGVTEGSAAGHSWKAATCTEAKTCKTCGAKEGSAAGHSWKSATCTDPKICRTCGTKEGSAAGHSWKAATCTDPKTCKACGATEGSATGHTFKDMAPPAPKTCTGCGATLGSSYGYEDLARNPQGKAMQALYLEMYNACEAFANSKDPVSPVDGKYMITKIKLDYTALSVEEAAAVWKIFKLDYPQYYWLSNTFNVLGDEMELLVDASYADGAYRSQCDAAVENLVAACAAKLKSGMNQLEKAMAIHDFILGQMYYAYEADGVTPQDDLWAHNLIGCAEKKTGVCESYAKAYQYLCRLNGLDCIVVTGFYGEEGHAWNMVELGGKWYGVDCTFDDTSGAKLAYNYFGINAYRLSSEYTADTPQNVGVDYLYALPQPAQQGIEPVSLYKDGGYVDFCVNIDTAFAAMTDPNGDYEIRLFKFTDGMPAFFDASTVAHRIVASQTPKVNSLAIRGCHTDLGNGYFEMTMVIIDSPLVLQSDVTVYDLDIYGKGSLDLQGNKLSCLGHADQFSIPISGSTDGAKASELYNGTDYAATYYGAVRIHTFRQKTDSGIRFAGGAYIVKAVTSTLRFDTFGGADSEVYVREICPEDPSAYVLVDIEGSDGSAQVTIDRITVPNGGIYITRRFGKLKDFGPLTLGTCDAEVTLRLDGEIKHIYTDGSGNVVGEETESVSPLDLTVPIATLKDASLMEKIKIVFTEWTNGGGYDREKTELYTLNSNNQIVLKK